MNYHQSAGGVLQVLAVAIIPLDFHVLFRAMFTGELAESRQTEVVIRDIDERAMELLIDFAYTSQVTTVAVNGVTLIFGFRDWQRVVYIDIFLCVIEVSFGK